LAKVAKTQGDSTPLKASASKPPIGGTPPPRPPSVKKGTYVASALTQQPTDQPVDNKKKGTVAAKDKEILADPNDLDKKLQIITCLDPR
jgi:hypothetical protein